MSTTITATATEPANELTAPTPGGDTDTWGEILNEQTLVTILAYILWLHENMPEGGATSLDDLTDVDTSGVQDGDALVYNADTSTWIPGAGGGGIAPGDGLVIVQHGATAATARPTAGIVLWRGSADPTNAAAGDLWDDSEDWD